MVLLFSDGGDRPLELRPSGVEAVILPTTGSKGKRSDVFMGMRSNQSGVLRAQRLGEQS